MRNAASSPPLFLPAIPKDEPRYEAKDITLKDDTIVLPRQWAIRILQETTLPGFAPSRGGVLTNNLIAFRSDRWVEGGSNVGADTAADTFQFRRNAWFCLDKPAQSRPRLPAAESEGIYGKDPGFRDPSAGDYRVGSPGFPQGVGARTP